MRDEFIWEINGYDEKGDLVKNRWPTTKLLPQTLRQFLDMSLRTEVALYQKQKEGEK